ncbi:hypothetical protein BH24ACT26_BH24ACT26_18090 [soil metagenome]
MIDFLLGLAEPWGYVLVALLAAGEGALLIGLFLPGEASMLLAGVLVYQGRASLGLMLLAGCGGAVIGDSIGYWLGRWMGPKLQRGALGRRVGEERWSRANDFLRRKGGRAVFVGRFIGFLRALLPTIAGQARLPYGRFLVANAAGGVLWAGGFILLGVAAGGSWHLIERWAGRATLVLGAILIVVAAMVLGARWIGGHLETLQERRRDLLQRPDVVRLRRRFRRQIDFVKRRLDRRQRFGLYMTVGLLLAVAGAWLFGAIAEDVVGNEEVVLIDRPVLLFLARHRESWLTGGMKGVTQLGGGAFVAVALGAAALVVYRATRQTRWPAFFAATLAGALGLDDMLKFLVGRPRPSLSPLVEVAGSSFPSGHATASAALFSALAFVLTRRRSWRSSVWIWTAAFGIALLVGLSRVYLGVHWPTDVLGGFALGCFWTTVAATATAAWPRAEGGEGSAGWG